MTPTEFTLWLDGFLLGIGRTHVGLNMDLAEIRKKLDMVSPHGGVRDGESKEDVAAPAQPSPIRDRPLGPSMKDYIRRDFVKDINLMREGERIPGPTNLKGYY